MYRKKRRVQSRIFMAVVWVMAAMMFSSPLLSHAAKDVDLYEETESETQTEERGKGEDEKTKNQGNRNNIMESAKDEMPYLETPKVTKLEEETFPNDGYIWGKDSKRTDTRLIARLIGESGGRMFRSTVGADVIIRPGTPHKYGSWGTCEFSVTTSSGQYLGYCAQPNLSTPNGTYRVSELHNDLIKAALLIAPGGVPQLYENYGKNIYNEKDNNVYAYAHALIGYLYMGSLKGLSSSMAEGIKHMAAVLNQLSQNPLDPSYEVFQSYLRQYKAYVAYTGDSDVQDIVWLEKNPVGHIKIKKISANPEITGGNRCYSLTGAEYGIYSNAACTSTKKVATMITDEDGNTEEKELEAGTYYIRELKASKGYGLDDCGTKTADGGWKGNAHVISVGAGESKTVTCTEPVTLIPVNVLLGKVDAETNLNKPQGSATLEDALFTVKFYPGIWDGEANPMDLGKRAARTWVFRTDMNGECRYRWEYLADGDELYLTADGKPGLPLGTLTIQETKAPEGYLINSEDYVVKLLGNAGSGGNHIYNIPVVPENILKLSISKTAATDEITDHINGGVVTHPIPDAVFLHTMPDGTAEEVTTDHDGQAVIRGLTYGRHTIEEISVPDGYTVNPGKIIFDVAEDNTVTVISNTSKDITGTMSFSSEEGGGAALLVEDRLAPYQLAVHKENEQQKKLEGAEFGIYLDRACTKLIGTEITDSDGLAGFEGLKVGMTYYLKETKAPQGYRLPVDSFGRPVVYKIRTKSNPEEERFQYFVNDKECTSDIGAITGTKARRVVNQTVINNTLVY